MFSGSMFLYFWLVLVELYKSLIHIILSEVGVLPFNQGWVLHVVTASIELRRDPVDMKEKAAEMMGLKVGLSQFAHRVFHV